MAGSRAVASIFPTGRARVNLDAAFLLRRRLPACFVECEASCALSLGRVRCQVDEVKQALGGPR